MIDYMV